MKADKKHSYSLRPKREREVKRTTESGSIESVISATSNGLSAKPTTAEIVERNEDRDEEMPSESDNTLARTIDDTKDSMSDNEAPHVDRALVDELDKFFEQIMLPLKRPELRNEPSRPSTPTANSCPLVHTPTPGVQAQMTNASKVQISLALLEAGKKSINKQEVCRQLAISPSQMRDQLRPTGSLWKTMTAVARGL